MIKSLKHLMFVCVVSFAACVTVNIYFPAAAIQKAADEIVNDVRGTQGNQEQKQQKQDKQSLILEELRTFSIGPKEASAQINVDVTTPAIRNLKQALKDNFSSLKPFYDKRAIGENNTGLVDTKDTAGLNLKEKADLKRVADQENNNRTALYNEIMKANKLGADALPKIQKIFANSWRDKSDAGWLIQNDKGEWEKKK
ncbi:MAG: DUF1318 domain-containing protein [Syntrophus sp. (in: bacteria)]|nr:DUF1318 domain-containing protein [Syntrophus sp. (in: bacteria)]